MTKNAKTQPFNAETGKILNIMINSLYSNKDIFLRELVSNASDACDKLRYEALQKSELLPDGGLKITIRPDLNKHILTITDNGIGMNEEDLINNLGTIARSGTQQFMETLTGDNKKDSNLIGQFGVGFYSAFMVADKITVLSKKFDSDKTFSWESEGQGEFTISEADEEISGGTIITLHMKKEEEDFLDKFRIDHIVKTYSDHIAVPIHMINEEGQEEEVLNSSSALWVRSKSDISEEEYKTFYHNVAHTGDEPWAILHNKAEGALEYTNLLYIPTVKPIDLFHPERKNRIKLYVKRVFITDENINLLPAYLRFVQGVVDSEDVPLNISRENLQHNAVITRISRALSKKILSEIKKKSEKDPESFDKFWKNFGPVIKEGLCDATIDRDAILDVCAFKTSKSNDKYISLKQYIENMKEGQENIFYLTGEDENAIKKSPKLEGFLKREIEVLLLTDSVDDFWVNVVNEYKDKTFQSINRTNIDLDSISPATELENKKDGEIEEVEAENVDEINALIEFLKETLKDRVSDIKISEKLVTSPACLSVGEHGMDIRMERFLVEQKQLPAASAKIFEVNVKHPIMKTIIADIKIDTESERAKELSLLLFDQACIIEGESVKDINAFSQRVNEFIQKALAA